MKKITIILVGMFFVASCSLQHYPIGRNHSQTTQETAACLRDPHCHQLFPAAHRGLGFGAPENSKETVQRAVDAGVPIIEIDVRLSRDNKVFVLHDATLDRTTSWYGKIGDYTSSELRFVTLANGESVPRFEEIYNITRGKSMINLDIKSSIVEELAEWIAQNGSFDDFIFGINSPDKFEKAARMKAKYPAMIISAEVYSDGNLETLKSYFPGALPEILDIGHPFDTRYRWLPHDAKVDASLLVFEIGLPFSKPILPCYAKTKRIDILMTNDPLFWMRHY